EGRGRGAAHDRTGLLDSWAGFWQNGTRSTRALTFLHNDLRPKTPRGPEMLFSYLGPETMMPVASVIAAVAGVFMMFCHRVIGFAGGLVRRVWPGASAKPAAKPGPESTDAP